MRRAAKRVRKDKGEALDVIGYARVSTQKQADSGLGLAAQERQLRAECEGRGWNLLRIETDKGRSAKTMSREGIERALVELGAGRADALMYAKSDRATRTVTDLYELMEDANVGKWHLIDLEMDVDTTDPTGEMLVGMRGVVSQWERKMIAKRTKDALAEKAAQGVVLGRPVLVSDASTARVLELRRSGLGMCKIADQLNAEGVATATGGRWHGSTVKNVLDRAA